MSLVIRRLTILCLLLLSSLTYSQWSLMVLDPQQTWKTAQGSIEEAVFSIGSKGLYSQVSAYLTFSAKGSNLSTTNPLEVVYNFELPEGSFVSDMWLWIGDKISNGKVMDLWTASQIYESIVKRKQDPAILKKTSARSYQLRIYPMGINETRKVKITYLTPVFWSDAKVTINIPTELLKVSRNQIPKVILKTWKNDEWRNPMITDPTYSFAASSDTFFGDHYEMDITNISKVYSNNLLFDNPMIGGVYFKQYKLANEGFYELAVFPGNALPGNSKKVLFLIDYDIRKSNTTRTELLSSLKQLLRSYFTKDDKFNIMYSGLNIGKVSDDWIGNDPANIEKVFSSLTENSISTYSNLPALMKEGCEYLNKNGASGTIFLLSNSDLQGNNTTANQLITDIRKLMTVNYPVMVYDYNDKDYVYYYFNNRSYVGNEYFYDNLSRVTGGAYQRIGSNLNTTLTDLFLRLNGTISSYDLYTSLQSGFCYGRQAISGKGGPISVSSAITQVGKYTGEFPFIVKTSGMFNSSPFTQTMVINNAADKKGADIIPKAWIGNYINTQTSSTVTNSIINEVIGLSRTHQILTNYTAFLALENDTSWCTTCYTESKTGGGGNTDLAADGASEIPTEFSMDAYPNPFNSQVTITVKLPNNMLGQKLSFKIFNTLGQAVKTFSSDEIQSKSVVKLFWDGKNDFGEVISSGVYLFNVSGGKFVKTLKLMYMK
ncbi:MAG: VIT domain-containing protein [Ignavibacteria bacterium]|nr:VIT domain-containing protein [Ignavibacteria bacterium]